MNHPNPEPKLLPTVLFYGVTAIAFCAFSIVALIRFHDDLSRPRIERLDQAILQDIHTHDTPTLTLTARTLSFIGSPLVLFSTIPIVAGSLWLLARRGDAVLLLTGMAGAGILESVIKIHFRRTRPDISWAFVHERSFSFPSGHSVLAVALYGIIAYILMHTFHSLAQRVLLFAGCFALIVGIGLSRIYLGVHYPSDVAAGYFVGAGWLFSVLMVDATLRGCEILSKT